MPGNSSMLRSERWRRRSHGNRVSSRASAASRGTRLALAGRALDCLRSLGMTHNPPPMEEIHATTVICVRRDGKVAVAGDGQVTVGNTVMKHGAAKVRRLYHDKIIAGFAGSAADAFALFSRFEGKLEEYHGNLERSVVELANDWRMDKYLRQLQAMLVVANAEKSFLISGTGDLIQPDED